MNIISSNKSSSKKIKMPKVFCGIFFVVFVSLILILVFGSSKSTRVDYQSSYDNFKGYYEDCEKIISLAGYDINKTSINDNYNKDLPSDFYMEKSYELDDSSYLYLYMKNENGREVFSIRIRSLHTEPESYQYVNLIIDLSDTISGYKFTANDIDKLINGKRGWRRRSKDESELINNEVLHNYQWIGIQSEWGADYVVEYFPDNSGSLYDNLNISGLTKTGTK